MKYCKSCNTPVYNTDCCPVCGLEKPTKGVWILVILTFVFSFAFLQALPWASLVIFVAGIYFIFKRKADIKKHRIDIENRRKNKSDDALNFEPQKKEFDFFSKQPQKTETNKKSSKKEDKSFNFELPKEEVSFYQKQATKNKYTERDKHDFEVLWSGSESIEFSYRDSKGSRTRREVILNTVKQNEYGELYFYGFCMERCAIRSFRVDRIKSKILWNGKKYDVDEFTNSF